MLGLAQLETTSKIDTHAAVHETVELIKKLGKPQFSGFINANLRSYLRQRDQLQTLLNQQPEEVTTSHTNWMLKRWRESFGVEAVAKICQANNLLPEMQIVINPSLNAEDVFQTLNEQGFEPVKDDNGIVIKKPTGLFNTDLTKQGGFLIQDSSVRRIMDIIKELPKKNVLDACASPGGKLFHMEWLYRDEIDTLTAMDISPGRVERLRDNAARFKSRAEIRIADVSQAKFENKFDLILADVPCSSTGTIRKHPEIKWNRRKEDFLTNQEIQFSIVKSLKDALLPGGHLLYITCSLEIEENQLLVNRVQDTFAEELKLIPLTEVMDLKPFLTPEGYYQCLPERLQNGAFAALFQKK